MHHRGRIDEGREERKPRGGGRERERGLDGGDVLRLNATWMLWDITDASALLQIAPLWTTRVLHPWKTQRLIERGQRRVALLHLAAYAWWMNGGSQGWRGGAVPCCAQREQGATRDLLFEMGTLVMGGNGNRHRWCQRWTQCFRSAFPYALCPNVDAEYQEDLYQQKYGGF